MSTTNTNKTFRIIVVGGGLGGLAARANALPPGRAIVIRPNATRILTSWGLQSDFEAVADPAPALVIKNYYSGDVLVRSCGEDYSSFPQWGCMRQKIQGVLLEQAKKAGAVLRFSVQVQDVSETESGVTVALEDGSTMEAYLVIAADGIRSRLRPKLLSDLGAHPESQLVGTTTYQVRMPLSVAGKDPRLAHYLKGESVPNAWRGAPKKYAIVLKFDKLDTLSGLFHVQGSIDTSSEHRLWDENGDIDLARKTFGDAEPTLQAMLEVAGHCDRWLLSELPDLPRWTSKGGRCILLDDAAHGMLPSAGQGFSTIVEDVAALGFFLSKASKVEIPSMMKAWQDFRKPRTERIKAQGHYNHAKSKAAGPPSAKGKAPEKKLIYDYEKPSEEQRLPKVQPDANAHFDSPAFARWCVDYDTLSEAEKFLRTTRTGALAA